jgi:hypothetical protein
MADPRTHTIKKIAVKDKPVLLNQLSAALFHLLELLRQKPGDIPTVLPVKKLPLKLRILKRSSPFLLTALFLPVLFVYCLVSEEGINKWLLCSLFVVTEINLFYIDIVLWKYFEGKKILLIWITEMFVILVAAYFVI